MVTSACTFAICLLLCWSFEGVSYWRTFSDKADPQQLCSWSSSLIRGRVAGPAHGALWHQISVCTLDGISGVLYSWFLPFPYLVILWRTFEFFCHGFYLGLICGEVDSLDHCICPHSTVIGRDPSWVLFEFILRKPHPFRISDLRFDLLFVRVHTSLENFLHPSKLSDKFEIGVFLLVGHYRPCARYCQTSSTIEPKAGTIALTIGWLWLR
jgi:hypothetical protein